MPHRHRWQMVALLLLCVFAMAQADGKPVPPTSGTLYRSPWAQGPLQSEPTHLDGPALRRKLAARPKRPERLLTATTTAPAIFERCDGTQLWRTGGMYFYKLSDPNKAPLFLADKLIQSRDDLGTAGVQWEEVEHGGRCQCEEGACSKDGDPTVGGYYMHKCEGGNWTVPNDEKFCMARGFEALSMSMGFEHVQWNYGPKATTGPSLKGWSHYLRPFDMNREQPMHEVGWGQWTKPGIQENSLSVCGWRPHGFTCGEDGNPVTEFDVASELGYTRENCGKLDWQSQASCKYGCCNQESGFCGVSGSVEGGMGYWLYTLETKHVKWMLPGSTVANYEAFGGTFLGDRPQQCTSLGGAVRISNRLLVPNDMVSFHGENIDGFLGYMFARTGVGKRSATDNANYWTIIVDTENFAGPAMYLSAWFWDHRTNWHPDSVSWSDPRALIGYIAQGFERGIGAKKLVDETTGDTYLRMTRIAFPKDMNPADGKDSITIFTGHSEYHTNQLFDAVEMMLDNDGVTPEQVKTAILAGRSQPECGSALKECQQMDATTGTTTTLAAGSEQECTAQGGQWVPGGSLSIEDATGAIWRGQFGIGATVDEGSAAASCAMRVLLDSALMDCTSLPGWCEARKWLKKDMAGNTVALDDAEVPANIKEAFKQGPFEAPNKNERNGPPDESERPCFEIPGPASDDLYCTRTEAGVWIGYRWYRFVDQPELNQVFASLKEGAERDSAKCYMQERVTRLHKAQEQTAASPDVPRWFDAPQGGANLPQGKVSIDPALLLDAPDEYKYGFVPVPIIEMKVKPENCAVVMGCFSEEQKASPGNPASGTSVNYIGQYEQEICAANIESLIDFSYLGTVFQYPHTDNTTRVPYAVPLRAEVQNHLSTTPLPCPAAHSSSGGASTIDPTKYTSTCFTGYTYGTTDSYILPTKAPTMGDVEEVTPTADAGSAGGSGATVGECTTDSECPSPDESICCNGFCEGSCDGVTPTAEPASIDAGNGTTVDAPTAPPVMTPTEQPECTTDAECPSPDEGRCCNGFCEAACAGDTTGNNGDDTTGDGTVITPTKTVAFDVQLASETVESFDDDKQTKFKLALAAALGDGVQATDITLLIEAVSRRERQRERRLQSSGIKVTAEVKAELSSADSVESTIKASTFQDVLQVKAVEQGAITSAAELSTDPASSFRVVTITTAAPSEFPTNAPSMDADSDPPATYPTYMPSEYPTKDPSMDADSDPPATYPTYMPSEYPTKDPSMDADSDPPATYPTYMPASECDLQAFSIENGNQCQQGWANCRDSLAAEAVGESRKQALCTGACQTARSCTENLGQSMGCPAEAGVHGKILAAMNTVCARTTEEHLAAGGCIADAINNPPACQQ